MIYDKGGCDFRFCNLSCLGPQKVSWPHMKSGGNATFAQFDRFKFEPSPVAGPVLAPRRDGQAGQLDEAD